ncbi:hypothetical protein Tco_1503195 [Tanacetum coccineum]
MKDPETKVDIETPYEKSKYNEKRQLGKTNEAKMTLYNALSRKEYERVFIYKTAKEIWHTLIITYQGNSQVKDCKIYLLTQQYEKFSISDKETIHSGFTRWWPKVVAIKEAKDLVELPLDELIGNLKVYEMVLRNDGVISKSTKEKVKSLALKAKVTRGQTSNYSVCQDGSDEEKEEEFNSIARNLWKLFKKGNSFKRENRFGNSGDRFDRGHGDRSKGVGSSRRERSCYGYGSKNHFVDDCLRAKVKRAFVGGAWSDSEDGNQIEKDVTYLMAIGLQKIVLALDNIKLLKLDLRAQELRKRHERDYN